MNADEVANIERLENLTDVAEHNLHEAIADLKERDAGIERLRRQRDEARAALARVEALLDLANREIQRLIRKATS